MPTRSHASPLDVLKLLSKGDKTSEQIIWNLKISANQWTILRGQMLKAKLIGIVHGCGQYTLLRKDDE